MSTTPAPAAPHAWADQAQLCRLAEALRPDADLAPVSIVIDGRSVGRTVDVDGETVQVDHVHVRWADLELAHELDPQRFGTAVGCPVCAWAAARLHAGSSSSTCPATGQAPHRTVPDTWHVDCLDCGAALDAVDDASLDADRRLGDMLDRHNRATVSANLAAMAVESARASDVEYQDPAAGRAAQAERRRRIYAAAQDCRDAETRS